MAATCMPVTSQRWNLPDGWVVSARPTHPGLVSEAEFIAVQAVSAARSERLLGKRPASLPGRKAAR
jgi:hypothetical protein